jgi:SagB-type dehydrogenase family enzyme
MEANNKFSEGSMISMIPEMSCRRSVRKYTDNTVDSDAIARLLWAAYGKNKFRRTVPSAGAIYPLVIYFWYDMALYRYVSETHSWEFCSVLLDKTELHTACLSQHSIMSAPFVIIVAADYDKIKRKYRRRGERYAILEAGHVGQNVHLMCEALGLGCVMIGAFSDRKVKAALSIDESPLYVIPVGKV